MWSRRSAVALLAAIAVLLVGPAAARAEWLSTREAVYATELGVQHRYRNNPYAYDGGVSGCQRLQADKVRCQAYLLSYSRTGASKYECDWPTTVTRQRGKLLYWLGPTRCHPIG